VTAIGGDVTNERTVTSLDSDVRGQLHKEYADNAARIEAANDLSVSAGRDINNIGSTLQAGRDLALNAGRDINTAATQLTDSLVLNSKHTSSDITQLGSTVSAGRDLSVQAGRDINAIASQIDAKRDIAMAATEDVTISSAADEEHSYSKSKKVKKQEDHVSQVQTEITAGGSVAVSAGQNLAVTSSRIAANDEAYLAAGNKLEILAAQDNDYSLYDMKKKGSFGAKKTKHDEVTDVKNIGSEITAGGNLVLVSGGDQQYQVAKLNSGKDLTINSGGAINFEGVKDLHQESHEKSNSNAAWNSMSGKGSTNETLRQSELTAKGNLVINAVGGLNIDIKQVNQQTVSQAIDAMVKADPDLAWLKDAEKRGDVDWRLVQEIHQSYKYSNSGLGVAAQLAIAILMAAFVGPAAAAMVGTGTGAAMVGAVAAGAATNATVSAVNNRGNLGAVFKDVTSSSAIKGYLTSAATAGIASEIGYDPIKLSFDVASAQKVIGSIAANAFVDTVINGGSFTDKLANAAAGSAVSIGGAVAANGIGDMHLDSAWQKVAFHAGLGGLLSVAMGGDFRSGALAAGANEAVVTLLGEKLLPPGLDRNSPEFQQASQKLLAVSQIVGELVASASGGDAQIGAAVAANATLYNYEAHWDVYQKKNAACRADSSGIGCATILKMAGTTSKSLGNVVLNIDSQGETVSYTILDNASQPVLILEPAEYQAYVTASTAAQESYVTAPQWQHDLASSLLHGNQGTGSKVAESLGLMYTDPGYWTEMALSAILSLTPGSGLLGGARATTTREIAANGEAVIANAVNKEVGVDVKAIIGDGPKGSSSETVPYFRVEGGGSGTKTSQNRITANEDGTITINPGCTGQICVSVGNADHASYYLTNKRPDGSVVVFDVDAGLHKEIMDRVVPQRPVAGMTKDPNAPKRVDKDQPGYSLELPKVWESLLEKNSSNARVYTQAEFFKEFKK
jgi:hypothetical protein